MFVGGILDTLRANTLSASWEPEVWPCVLTLRLGTNLVTCPALRLHRSLNSLEM